MLTCDVVEVGVFGIITIPYHMIRRRQRRSDARYAQLLTAMAAQRTHNRAEDPSRRIEYPGN